MLANAPGAIRNGMDMRLLLPIDGSQCSQHAVEYVVASRPRFDAGAHRELHLAYVQSPVTGDVSHFVGGAQVADNHREESGKALASAPHAFDVAGLPHAVHTTTGHRAEALVRLAKRPECDQIAMRTHGRGAFAELLVGSTTLRVLHHTKNPLLLVN